MEQILIDLCSVALTEITRSLVSVDLVLGYVFPNSDRNTFRGFISIFIYATIFC